MTMEVNMQRKEIIALLLAGGQGSRLGVLTKNIAKPAVLYGGKYRIVDFSLSNCVNSQIDTVGVLTQYQPLKLTKHIGIGSPWDLDRMNGGLIALSPHIKEETGEWYKGTANAVFQNLNYIQEFNPKYVIILSGDHIYKMNYSLMLDYHKEKDADVTISVINVPIEEASRYGLMSVSGDGRIYDFKEKPQNPDSTLASMGVYIFTWEALERYLSKDNADMNSSNDFGKNIIPNMLQNQAKLFAYRFDGYWKDVGTIQAYWESNMDLVNRLPEFNLYDKAWKICTTTEFKPASIVSPNGSLKKCIVADGCTIKGKVSNSVIFNGVQIEDEVEIEDSIIMSNCKISKGSIIKKSILCEDVFIGENVRIGVGENIENELFPHIYNSGITVVGETSRIPNDVTLGKNVMVDIGIKESDFGLTEVNSGVSILKEGDAN
jgi:glucose-1-phosphate adenylyltransferase